MNKRKVWVEPLFAEAKDWHGMRQFRLRLLWRVNIEALRIAAGQNLKRLLKKRGWGRRPFPTEAMWASFGGLCSPSSRGVSFAFADWFSLLNDQDAMRLSLLMSLMWTFSTGWIVPETGRRTRLLSKQELRTQPQKKDSELAYGEATEPFNPLRTAFDLLRVYSGSIAPYRPGWNKEPPRGTSLSSSRKTIQRQCRLQNDQVF